MTPSSNLRIGIFFYLKMGQKLDTLHFGEITSDIETKYVTAVTHWMPMYVMITADDVR